MNLPHVQIKDDERVAFVGTTGMGKSELAKHFLRQMNRVLVIDPKHTFKLDGFQRGRSLPLFGNDYHIIFRPQRSDDETLADICYTINKNRGATIYCDELMTLSEQFPATTEQLGDIARTGRERHVALWSAMQRPRWIPRVFLTETEIFFQFHLRSGEDRKYMSQYTGIETLNPINKFRFWYSRIDDKLSHLMTLDLASDGIMAYV